jgi:hypothetical protein
MASQTQQRGPRGSGVGEGQADLRLPGVSGEDTASLQQVRAKDRENQAQCELVQGLPGSGVIPLILLVAKSGVAGQG